MLAINKQYDNISTASTTTQTTNNNKTNYANYINRIWNGLPGTTPNLIQQFDVTDNKTDFIGYSNQRNMDELLKSEEERLKTFANWPVIYIDKNVLAKVGMYYYGDTDKVKCFFCDVIIGRWEETDNPITEHIRWSPNCPLLKRRTTNNQPIDLDLLDRILPPASYDVCGANDIIEVRPSAYAEGTIQAPTSPTFLNNTPISSPNFNNYNTTGTQFAYPDHPEYAIESARLRSYRDCWPITMKQKPEQLSEAGFFYTGIGDRVKCFSCGGGLKDWDDTDEPWEQHALWLSNCRYLKLIKGSSFIDQIKEKYKSNTACNENELKQNDLTSTSSSSSSTSSSPSKELRTTSTSTSTETNEMRLDDDSCKNNTVLKNLNNNNNNNENCCSKSISFSNSTENQEKKQLSEEKLCKICYAGEYNTAFLPCGHVVACAKCASSVTKCPMCRKPFTDVMRVYFS